MANNQDRKPQSHLINILKSTRDHHPNFALFLGAGASVTSKVKMAGDMIKEWHRTCHKMYGPGKDLEKYLKAQPWHDCHDEYSILFELLYDQPSQRREYIESCVKDCKPSWGYIYLVNLLKNGIFNTVFTTNFDDLLTEACYQFSDDVRPIVCAHDSSIRSIRITSKRPKIIKLHGDFLFDNIKNTVSELETLEDNMKEKFKQFASEYGLIFVGYSGHDRSIMETLNLLLKTENNFPHGVYWCVRKGSKVETSVDLLSRFPKFKLIEIEGFDEFFAEVHASLELELQPELSDPYGSLVKRLNNLIQNTKIPEPTSGKQSQIQRDIALIGQKVSLQVGPLKSISADEVDSIELQYGSGRLELPIPFELLSQLAKRAGDRNKALDYLLREVDVRPSSAVFMEAFKLLSESKSELHRVDELINRLKGAKDVLLESPFSAFDMSIALMNAGLYEKADEVLGLGLEASKRTHVPKHFDHFYTLNKLQIKVHAGKTLDKAEQDALSDIVLSGNDHSKMGAFILLRNYRKAEETLKQLFEDGKVDQTVASWPIVKLLLPHIKDNELREMLSDKKANRRRPGQEFEADMDAAKPLNGVSASAASATEADSDSD